MTIDKLRREKAEREAFEAGRRAGIEAARNALDRVAGRWARPNLVLFVGDIDATLRALLKPAEPAHRQTQEHPFVAIWGSDGHVCGRCSLAPEAHASSAKPAPQRSPPPRYDDVYAAGVAALDAEPARGREDAAYYAELGAELAKLEASDPAVRRAAEKFDDLRREALAEPAPQLGVVPAPLPYDDRCATCGGSGWTYVSLGVHGYRGESCPDCTGAKPGEGGR